MRKIFLMFVLVLLVTACGIKTDKDEKENKYASIEVKMMGYYDEYYNNLKASSSITEEIKDNDLRITLKNLQVAKYDLTSFKNVDTGEACDLEKSFAIVDQTPDKEKNPDDEYVITIYYECGDYVNKEYNLEQAQ